MKKCIVCLEGKARRECLLREGSKICSRCCAELRGSSCGECPHYEEILRYEAERWRTTGSPPEGHFIAEIIPEVQEAVYDTLALAMEGKMAEAMPVMERLARNNPRSYDAHYGMGVLYGLQGRHNEAIECFRECLGIFPYFADAYYNLAVSYGQSYQIEKSARAYRKAVKYGDPSEEYYAAAKSALEHMAQVIQKNNGVDLDTYLESSVIFDQAFECMEAGKWDEALSGFLACAKLVPNGLSTHGNMALCYANLGRKADALAAFDRALELDPTYAIALDNRRIAERMEEGVVPEGLIFRSANYAVDKLERKKRS